MGVTCQFTLFLGVQLDLKKLTVTETLPGVSCGHTMGPSDKFCSTCGKPRPLDTTKEYLITNPLWGTHTQPEWFRIQGDLMEGLTLRYVQEELCPRAMLLGVSLTRLKAFDYAAITEIDLQKSVPWEKMEEFLTKYNLPYIADSFKLYAIQTCG